MMLAETDLTRFIEAQANDYDRALAEVTNGHKQSHWMWYIFPQIAGLGVSETARFYAIKNLDEANAYLQHPVLGGRLIEISKALLAVEGKTANQILGSIDELKLRSSMTLFGALPNTNPVFQAVLDKFFNGQDDPKTRSLM
ncbi:DUF1810 domain-containing protein [Spirosoma lituiforme]